MKAKVVYNNSYGMFSISEQAIAWLKTRGVESTEDCHLQRHDPLLVDCVLELGKNASGKYAELKVHSLHGMKYRIDEYDGLERVVEPNNSEWTIISEDEIRLSKIESMRNKILAELPHLKDEKVEAVYKVINS